ncbi:MAG: Fe3+-hydroxamate ABC transporter substrate-binding protein [Acidobacteria bacterium]|nr:MAG: Fe3+-hydroxamate ABC transporter substrate-binding protein [Acidobacteriota bacterium]
MPVLAQLGDFTPRRVVSLQPSITSTMERLGLLDRLAACTKYCADVCPAVKQRGIPIIEDSWTADSEQIRAVNPDLVIASVPYQVEAVAEILKSGAQFLGLAPHSLRDVYADIAAIAGIMNEPNKGHYLIREMQMEIERVRSRNMARENRPTVYCEEWGKPLIHSQHWVAELVEAAGGRFVGEAGKQTTPDTIQKLDPDVIIAAWCGAGDRVPLEKIIVQRGWESLKAARAGRVYCINDEYLNTPGPTLLAGLHALEAAIHGREVTGLRRIAAMAPAK